MSGDLNVSDLVLTDQQQAFLARAQALLPDEKLLVLALAGTSKTTCLKLLSIALPHKRFLYLGHDSKIVKNAQESFPKKNTESRTYHSVAYEWVRPGREIKRRYTLQEICDITTVCQNDAAAIRKYFEEFTNSSLALEEFLKSLEDKVSREIRDGLHIFVSKMLQRQIPFTHSGYLKAFQLMDIMIEKYDYVVMDEGQDINQVAGSIFIDRFRAAKIIVGDNNQKVYGWKGSRNFAKEIVSDYQLYLTGTFRCSQAVVDKANRILEIKDEKIRLNSMVPTDRRPPLVKKRAIITRANSTLIEYIAEYDSFVLTTDPEKIFAPVMAVQNCLNGHQDRIPADYAYLRNIKGGLAQIAFAAETHGDEEVQKATMIAKKHGNNVFGYFKKALQLYSNANARRNTPITLTTAHSAKGMEFDSVYVDIDFSYTLNRMENVAQAEEELNLIYVAYTRARFDLDIHPSTGLAIEDLALRR